MLVTAAAYHLDAKYRQEVAWRVPLGRKLCFVVLVLKETMRLTARTELVGVVEEVEGVDS